MPYFELRTPDPTSVSFVSSLIQTSALTSNFTPPTPTTGCVGAFTLTTTSGTTFTVAAGSDDESAFDPFGSGQDSSDQIQFIGLTPITEQSSFADFLLFFW